MDEEDEEDHRYSNMVSTVTFQKLNYHTTSDPRMALVLYNASARARVISDDKGLDFFGFPREIRDEIYSHIFVKPSAIGAESKFTKPFWRDAIKWRNHNLAGTCRQIWNESLRVYLRQNAFEFYFIRPFLEFLEKIGIRGRRLLTNVRWSHHARSMPFIAIRLLRSCTNLRNLEVFARLRVKERPGFLYRVPLLHAKRFFLTTYKRISFGNVTVFGKLVDANEEMPDLRSKLMCGEYEQPALRTLSQNLKKVKWEISGHYKRYDLPDIWMNGMCHWKYQMLDDLKRKRKEEADAAKPAATKRRKTDTVRPAKEHSDMLPAPRLQITHGQPSAESTPERGTMVIQESALQDNLDEESIDKDDGYAIENGNLVKDGILVARGHIFDED